MTAMSAALLQAYQANHDRYCQLLATDLTNDERRDLHGRIAETQRAINRLEAHEDLDLSREAPPPSVFVGWEPASLESRAHL